MFKKSSDKQNYIERTGSHATKESPTGRIDAIPHWAREPEEYYNSVRDQWHGLIDQLTKTEAQLAEINEKLRARTLPFKAYEHLRLHKERLASRVNILMPQAASYRELARAAGANAWAIVFYDIAKRLLSPEDFMALCKETTEIIGRHQYEITGTRGHTSGQARKQKRKRYRLSKARHNRLVWDDKGATVQRFNDDKEINRKGNLA